MSLQQTLLGRFASLESDVPAAGGVSDALEIGQVVDEDGAQLDGENLVENDLIEAAEEAAVPAEVVAEAAVAAQLTFEEALAQVPLREKGRFIKREVREEMARKLMAGEAVAA